MANEYFHFKQFSIFQDKCAMKVGTDGVLLGAWVSVEDEKNILDIGTGTGLLALMMAQRTLANIDAIEIDETAAKQAGENVLRSRWSDRVVIHHAALQDYFPAHSRYDLILSNPPYFSNINPITGNKRVLARQSYALTMNELISGVCRLMTPAGRFALIYPAESFNTVTNLTKKNGLFALRITRVLSTPGDKPIRILAEFSNSRNNPVQDTLIIEEKGRHQYSEKYRKLTQDFYLDKN